MSYSESTEEYLKTICKLRGGSDPVAVSTLADHLNISPVSTHEMVKKLAEQGLVIYQPYKGVMLTSAGVVAANRVLRRHRLWERFLHDTLGLPWAQVHEEANRLEHMTSSDVAEKLAEFLDNPDSCPHGHPIGESGCECEDFEEACMLSDLTVGDTSVVLSVPEDDLDLLTYVDTLGLRPKTPFRIIAVAPLDGPVTIEIRGKRKVIGRKLAMQITVRSNEEPDSPESAAA